MERGAPCLDARRAQDALACVHAQSKLVLGGVDRAYRRHQLRHAGVRKRAEWEAELVADPIQPDDVLEQLLPFAVRGVN